MNTIHDVSLRERKFAQTKVSLARAFRERLREKRLQDISVKEVCDTLPISEVTFYKYFPEKTDVLVYLLQLWHYEAVWRLRRWEREKTNLEVIEAWFKFGEEQLEAYPAATGEIISFIMKEKGRLKFSEISVAELLFAYPDLEDIEKIEVPAEHHDDRCFMLPYLYKAIEHGELPSGTDVEMVADMLDAIFIGSQLTLREESPQKARKVSSLLLKYLWQGIRSEKANASAAHNSSSTARRPKMAAAHHIHSHSGSLIAIQ